MTDSEKLLTIVDHCQTKRRVCVDAARADLRDKGWATDVSEVSNLYAQFILAGELLGIAGHPDDLNWARDALGAGHSGASRIGGSMPS